MTTTDLKPGDIVQHPMWGNGVVAYTKFGLRVIGTSAGYECIFGLTGWERAETVRPGHVQVSVDDLDLGPDMGDSEEDFVAGWQSDFPEYSKADLRLIYRAIAAQRAESTTPADEQNASATEAATYQCPWCSTDVNFSVALNRNPRGGVMAWVEADGAHTCPPAQPDEPTEFGARIVVTDGLSVVDERWCRQHDGYWANEDSELMTWAYLCQRGTVTLGWDE